MLELLHHWELSNTDNVTEPIDNGTEANKRSESIGQMNKKSQ